VREVSCRALDPFFQAADRAGISRDELARGVGYPRSLLEDRHERIDWDAFRRFMANVRGFFDEQALTEIGAVGLKQPGFRSFALIGRTLFSASGFYRWMLTSGGMGNQLFSNMSPSFRELGPGRIDLDLQVAPGYEPCPDFFHFAAGGFQALPELVGLQRARVSMVWIDRGARFEIEFEARSSRRAKLLRLITRSSDARATAKELNEAIHVLEQRNVELVSIREQVERQRALLDVAYQLGQEIFAERDLKKIARSVIESLISRGGVAGVRFAIAPSPAIELDGGRMTGEPVFTSALPGEPSRGRIEIWAADQDVRGLMELVLPTVTLAIDNAIAYRELAEYQRGLEQQVDQRTAELRQARDELAGTVDQLREAQGARERFFANISHEIRTPLSLILLAVSDISARAGVLLDARASASLASVADAAHKLVRLVDELLLLAAGQEGKLQIAPEPTDVVELVEHLMAAWRPAAEVAGLELTSRTPASLVAMVDPVALERIATNLVSNAVKYTPRGGSIVIELADEPELRLSVFDTGPGIGDELASRLFGRFERAAGEDRRKIGSGIGLSLVKQLVEAHGGTVAAMPRAPGPGSELRVSLPRIAVDADVAPVAPRRGELAVRPSQPAIESGERLAPAELSAGTILLAEDDARLAEMVARLLSDDYAVIVALDGDEAVRLVRQHQPQLLITDVDMPGLDGIQLAKQFREITNDALAPIIILSAVLDRGTRLAGLEAGAIDYITKPFDPAELRARVKAQFRMRDLALRLHRAEQLSALGILTSGLAHELRNPANGIVNAVAPLTKLLPSELTSSETAVGQLLEVMESCANQIGFLTRQLLSIRPGGTQLELQPAEMPELVDRAVALAHRALAGVEVRSTLEVDQAVMCAPPLMVQVLVNLIENAGHAAGRGGWVKIDGRAGEGRVTLEIADSGPGVPVELRDRVFEPFFTTKPPGAGSGLGLPLARAIVLRHGGVLEIRERGRKPVFVMELPHSPHATAAGAV
jgi:signal transduction histidine kinase